MYSTQEFSIHTGVPVPTLYRWKNTGILVPIKIGKYYFYDDSHIEKYNREFREARESGCKNIFTDLGNNVSEVLTTNGNKFYISTSDVSLLIQFGHTWYIVSNKQKTMSYVATNIGKTSLYLHNFLIQPKSGFEVDHSDGNGLNNVRSNLREATRCQNCQNRRVSQSKKSKLPRGVYHCDRGFTSFISVNKKKIYLGYFLSKEDAIRAREEAEIKYYGEFRRNTK